ncbi:MAG: response regulator [Deltaproteobacteria bacterium]|nr:response regulator [Deltaproteobacteria bacterium]
MRAPRPPENEAQRLERLESYEVLDTLPEQVYQDIVTLAAEICGTPIALVSLVDDNRQWFKARFGLDAEETPRDVSFCGHVVESSQPLYVSDSHEDERFADNPLVTGGPLVRFYAGAPLTTDDGLVLGTLCVIDHDARELSDHQKELLAGLSRLVMSQLNLRLQLRRGKELRQEIDQAREKAESADRIKSQFLATMSHELRTPLNAVIGFSKILIKNKADKQGPKELEYLSRILENGKHLLELINEVLDISKVEAGQMTFSKEPCDVASIVDTTLRLQESVARENSVELVSDVPADLDLVTADPHRLRQVFTNLISNAIKFTDEGGSATVRVRAYPETRRVASIEVIDTGIGVPADQLDLIFEPFKQADGSSTRRHGGTGLGLPISRAFCQGMGLQLSVSSEVGVGTTFRIDVPISLSHASSLNSSSAADAGPSDASEGERRAGRRVLVVDDNADARQLIAEQLRELGCDVRLAQNGTEGLRLARAWRPDLITLDLMMPSANGWQALDEVRNDPALREVPVVVISMVAHETRPTLVGAAEVLSKPVSQVELINILERLGGDSRRRALIIEDNADARLVLADFLEAEGWEVAEAINGQEGLLALGRFSPDIIFLDLMMPVMDGAEFLERVRGSLRYSAIPIVIVTAKDLADGERSDLLQKAHAVLSKDQSLETELRTVLESISFAAGDAQEV